MNIRKGVRPRHLWKRIPSSETLEKMGFKEDAVAFKLNFDHDFVRSNATLDFGRLAKLEAAVNPDKTYFDFVAASFKDDPRTLRTYQMIVPHNPEQSVQVIGPIEERSYWAQKIYKLAQYLNVSTEKRQAILNALNKYASERNQY